MFFLIPKNITSEADFAYADVDTKVGSAEGIRGGEVAAEVSHQLGWYRWPKGDAQRTVWEILMETERYKKEQEKKIKEQQLWFWTWRRLSSGSVSLWSGSG